MGDQMRLLSMIASVVLVSACATTENYEKTLDTWVGATEAKLVSAWGPPDSVYEAPNGERILTYNSQRTMSLPGLAPSYRTTVVGNVAHTQQIGGTPARAIPLSCRTSFTIGPRYTSPTASGEVSSAELRRKKGTTAEARASRAAQTEARKQTSRSTATQTRVGTKNYGVIKTWSYKGNDCTSY